MIFLWLLLMPFSLFGIVSWESPKNTLFAAKVTISAEKMTLRDRLKVELNVVYPKDYNLDPNLVRDHLLRQSGFDESPFKLASETIGPPTAISDHTQQQKFIFELDPLLTGIHHLSFFNLTFLHDHSNSNKVELYTYIFSITVEADDDEIVNVMNSPLMMFDLTLPVDISPENRRHLLENPKLTEAEIRRNKLLVEEKSIPWLAMLGLLLAGAFVALSMRKEVKPETDAEKQQKIKTLKEASLEQIEIAPTANTDTFYVELTDVVRHYIEKKFGIHSPNQTTEEFLHSMKEEGNRFNKDQQQLLEEFLSQADRVKFAKYMPSAEEKEKTSTAAKNFIISS